MKNIFILVMCLAIISCEKKDEANTDPLYIDFIADNNTGATLPVQVTFRTYVPDGADAVSWDFGDGTTGGGEAVSHTYTNYGVYEVTISGNKGSQTGSLTKKIPITIYKKLNITKVSVLQTPLMAPGNVEWDNPGDGPDLNFRIYFPDYLYSAVTVLNNRDTGSFSLAGQGTFDLDSTIKIEILDRDTDATPNYQIMSSIKFSIAEQLQFPFNNLDTINLDAVNTRIRILATWVP